MLIKQLENAFPLDDSDATAILLLLIAHTFVYTMDNNTTDIYRNT